jgi:CRP/FNR family transcriptional regulator
MVRANGRPALKTASCGECRLNGLCLPVSLDERDIKAFDRIVHRHRPLPRGAHLFRGGARFRSIYAVRSGALKSVMHSSDGEEYVSGLHLAGEVIGLDAIDRAVHPASAVALDTTAVCEIPFHRLESLSTEIPRLHRRLVKLMSRELLMEQAMAQTIATRSAEQRVAATLLNLAERSGGGHCTRFRLPASRHDLSNYLGLAPETLSRLFRRIETHGLVAADGREVTLLDPAGLSRLAGRESADRPMRRPASLP